MFFKKKKEKKVEIPSAHDVRLRKLKEKEEKLRQAEVRIAKHFTDKTKDFDNLGRILECDSFRVYTKMFLVDCDATNERIDTLTPKLKELGYTVTKKKQKQVDSKDYVEYRVISAGEYK